MLKFVYNNYSKPVQFSISQIYLTPVLRIQFTSFSIRLRRGKCSLQKYIFHQVQNTDLIKLSALRDADIHKTDNFITFGVDFQRLHSILSKKWPVKSCQMSVDKRWLKMISLENWKILTLLPKLPKNVGDFGKVIVATGFEKVSKVQ